MLKNFPWKTVLLTVLAWWLFWDIKEGVYGERPFFLFRWLGYEKSFAKHIEVRPYLLTDEQVVYMLQHPEEEVSQLSPDELHLKELNVVLRVKSLEGGTAYGDLAWRVDYGFSKDYWNVVNVQNISKDDPNTFKNFIIPIGKSSGKHIEARWDALYLAPKG